MTRLVSFEIAGLAGRKGKVTYEFRRDLNVFWGLNGCGKTSLLKILHSALWNTTQGLGRVPFTEATVTFFSDRSEKVVTRSIRKPHPDASEEQVVLTNEYSDLEEVEEVEYLYESRFNWSSRPELQPVRARHRYLPISRMTDAVNAHSRVVERRTTVGLLNEREIDQEFARQTVALWRDYSNKALIRIRQAQELGLATILTSVLAGEQSSTRTRDPKVPSDIAYETLVSFFHSQRVAPRIGSRAVFQKRYEKDGVLRDVVNKIADIEETIHEAQAPQRRLLEVLDSLFMGRKKITLDARRIQIEIGEDNIPLESLSSGEKQILRLLLECLATNENCIIIDEPELSLHVDWQNRLVKSMQAVNPHAQIILATHSPEVMANIPFESVFEL